VVRSGRAYLGSNIGQPVHLAIAVFTRPQIGPKCLSMGSCPICITMPRLPEVAEQVGVNTASVYFWETDHVRPRDANLSALCRVLRLPIRATREIAAA